MRLRIFAILPAQTGMKKDGGTWTKSMFVGETVEKNEKDSVKVAITKWSTLPAELKIGSIVQVETKIVSREYQGKWYTDIIALDLQMIGSSPEVITPEVINTPEAVAGNSDDLPF